MVTLVNKFLHSSYPSYFGLLLSLCSGKYMIHKNAKIAFDRLGKCLEDVKLWLCANKLKLNADKTDFIIFGSNKKS